MTAAELFCAIFDASPVPGKDGSFTTLSARSVEVAIIVARDKWTDADTQTHGEKYREVIFKWAEEFGEAHARARVPRRLDVDAAEQWKEFSDLLNSRCSVCGKQMREHTLQDFLAFKRSASGRHESFRLDYIFQGTSHGVIIRGAMVRSISFRCISVGDDAVRSPHNFPYSNHTGTPRVLDGSPVIVRKEWRALKRIELPTSGS